MDSTKTSDIAAILDTLSPEHKQAIESRLIAMSQAAFDANAKLAPLEEQVIRPCLNKFFCLKALTKCFLDQRRKSGKRTSCGR